MDKVRAIRHSVKSVLAAAAILSAAFVTLHMFRPDVAAKLTGVKYDNNSASEKTFFEALLGTGKDKSIRASDRNLKGISSDWLSSERSRNSGSATSRRSLLQRQYADLAYGNALSAKQYVPFTYQDTTTTGFVSQSTGDATRRKTVHKPTTSRNQTGMVRRHRTVETMAPPAAITEPASAPGRQFATINRVEIRSDKDKPTELAETFKALGEKIALGKSKAQSSRDDAEIAILLLGKSGQRHSAGPSRPLGCCHIPENSSSQS